MLESVDILIVDDQPRARASLKALITTQFPSARIVEATNGAEALAVVEQIHPKIVLMDARMPEMDGVQATRLIKTRWPETRVVVLSMFPEYKTPALIAGADAVVSKGEAPEELLDALQKAAAQWPGTLLKPDTKDIR